MPLQIDKCVLVTGIDQEGQRAQITCHNDRDNRNSIFNVTVKDFTGNELRSQLAWRFVVDYTDPQNVEVLRNIVERQNNAVERSRKEWDEEQDPKVHALIQEHLDKPPVFYLKHIGRHPIVIAVGMGAMILAQGHDSVCVSDYLGDITDITLI